MKKILFFFALSCGTTPFLFAQKSMDSLKIDAKVWSKDENKQVHYSDWGTYSAITPDRLKDFDYTAKPVKKNKYGGTGKPIDATGFFHTKKVNNRWYVIDPLGCITYITAVNSIRTAKASPLPQKYKDNNDWASQTLTELSMLGFNTAGCWSDVDAIIEYNRHSSTPVAYTIQLNLLSNYATDAKRKNPERKKQSTLSFLLDESFPSFCANAAMELNKTNTDPNLLGIFSDNELPFTTNELKNILAEKNESDKCYIALKEFLKQQQVDENAMTKEQQKVFLGKLAYTYYSTVSNAIKTADKNHMYIGSRIHSNAKNNEFLFKAASPFIDIISINYYGDWQPRDEYLENWSNWSDKPFFITEFYTKAAETGMSNMSGAGWIVRTQEDRGIHYQNFCLQLLKTPQCVGWHWFRYQDNDPNDTKADDSNKDSNKGIVNIGYETYKPLAEKMKSINTRVYDLINYFDKKK